MTKREEENWQWVNKLESWDHLKFWKYQYQKIEEMELWRNKDVFPHYQNWFKAMEVTPYEKVKCVILGQDPYHTPGMANGLAFSVYPHVKPFPPSLRNIFTEYSSDLGYDQPRTGDLLPWAERGVLLLNTCLTVERGKPHSHRNLGWDKLAYEVLRSLDERDEPVAFCLWGKAAQEYQGCITNEQHCVFTAAHPSPYSASHGYFGCKHFSKVNEFLGKDKKIDWKLP